MITKKHLVTDFIQFLLEKEDIKSKTLDKDTIKEKKPNTNDSESTKDNQKIDDLEFIEDGDAEKVIENLVSDYKNLSEEFENLFKR